MKNLALEAMRAERLAAVQRRAAALGVAWRFMPEAADLFPAESAELERQRRRQDYAALLGVDWRYLPELD